jgi:endonuclease/exonuclease/phosphatase family metal-dependent hydrolase
VSAPAAARGGAVLRCVTFNLWGEQGPAAERLRLTEQALRELAPDVVALQEVREIPGVLPNQAATLAAALGMHHVFAPAIAWGGGHEGLALLSRHPIGAQAQVELPAATASERRVLLSARLDTDAGPVWIHNTHLNYRLHHGREREQQVRAIHAVVTKMVPDNPQILMGDFNARPESDEIRWLRGLTSLGGERVFYQDAWALLHPHEPGWTWTRANPHTDALAFLELDRRLDYVFVTPRRKDGRGIIHDCRLVLDRPDERGLYPSDHFGVLAEVQTTPGPVSLG